jgi:Fic family protein
MASIENTARLGRTVETAVGGEIVRAYVPAPLPPDPPIDVLGLLPRLIAAERSLGRLHGITVLLPMQDLFVYMYVRKEAVLSSQIEGTQSSLSDLLRFETDAAAGQPIDDVAEVSNYVDAMNHGLARLDTLPLCLRLIREIHGCLMRGVRGASKDPGEFRRSQNWIGGTRPGNAAYVPPPILEMHGCLDAFERYMHEEDPRIPTLIKAALLHVQFESIHPFLDGNGRVGRLLVTLFLCAQGVVAGPLLYLSVYLKAHRADYYRLLQEVRERGAWEAWLEFFLDGVRQTADQAFDAAIRIVDLFKADSEAIAASSDRAGSALRLHACMQTHPYATAPALVRRTGLSAPTVNAALADLQRLGVVQEVTGRRRGRVFAYGAYLAILNEGAEPLADPAPAAGEPAR